MHLLKSNLSAIKWLHCFWKKNTSQTRLHWVWVRFGHENAAQSNFCSPATHYLFITLINTMMLLAELLTAYYLVIK